MSSQTGSDGAGRHVCVSSATSGAALMKTMKRPLAPMSGAVLWPARSSPVLVTLTRVVTFRQAIAHEDVARAVRIVRAPGWTRPN